eukprot:7820759-Pyramimonas_sp.AAC.1
MGGATLPNCVIVLLIRVKSLSSGSHCLADGALLVTSRIVDRRVAQRSGRHTVPHLRVPRGARRADCVTPAGPLWCKA